jgi:hypothetical protein
MVFRWSMPRAWSVVRGLHRLKLELVIDFISTYHAPVGEYLCPTHPTVNDPFERVLWCQVGRFWVLSLGNGAWSKPTRLMRYGKMRSGEASICCLVPVYAIAVFQYWNFAIIDWGHFIFRGNFAGIVDFGQHNGSTSDEIRQNLCIKNMPLWLPSGCHAYIQTIC